MSSAVKLLMDELQREQASQREILRSIMNKLPDEHTIRAIKLDAQATRAPGPTSRPRRLGRVTDLDDRGFPTPRTATS